MPIPTEPVYFPPQETRRLFAAGEAFFLIDPARLEEVAGSFKDDELLGRLQSRQKADVAFVEGALVPAFGLEPGFYNVLVRSTETEGAMLPLSHVTFSSGFVLGTETGQLMVCNAERLQHWTPGMSRLALEGQGVANVERAIRVEPGWYSVTVVAGIHDVEPEEGPEQWIVCFLLEPRAAQPEFLADPQKMLNLFG